MIITIDHYNSSRTAKAEILNSHGVYNLVAKKTMKIKDAANGMFGAKSYCANTQPGNVRVHGIVYTGDKYAMRSNHVHNTLLKALRGAR